VNISGRKKVSRTGGEGPKAKNRWAKSKKSTCIPRRRGENVIGGGGHVSGKEKMENLPWGGEKEKRGRKAPLVRKNLLMPRGKKGGGQSSYHWGGTIETGGIIHLEEGKGGRAFPYLGRKSGARAKSPLKEEINSFFPKGEDTRGVRKPQGLTFLGKTGKKEQV